MNDPHDVIKAPIIKFVSALAAFLTLDFLTTAGKVCGALYAMAILGEWLWKRIGKPFARHMGWIKPKPMRPWAAPTTTDRDTL